MQENKTNGSQNDQRNFLGEAEKYYKNIIEQQKVTHSMLEADLGRAEKQIEILKKERKIYTIKEDLNALSKDALTEPKTVLPLNADNLKALANNERAAHKDNGQEIPHVVPLHHPRQRASHGLLAGTSVHPAQVGKRRWTSPEN